MTFLDPEKTRYAAAKPTASWLSPEAKAPGHYGSNDYDFCIPMDHADENLFAGTRERLLDYFDDNSIQWHDGAKRRPSNHLCSSMVCGVNFLSVMMDDAPLSTRFLRGVFGDEVLEAAPVAEASFVEFEWVGNPDEDYINEGKNRTRGANATSADGAMAYLRPDGGKTLVLIEWKYTESYRTVFMGGEPKGPTRRKRYASLLAQADCPIDPAFVSYEELLYEPFYQFMRQQLLAWQMQARGKEVGADRVRVLHMSPRANIDFGRITAPALAERYPGMKATDVWRSLLRNPELFTPVPIEDAFADAIEGPADTDLLASWQAYVRERYPWTIEAPTEGGSK